MILTHTLGNGLTLMMERLPALRSAAIGVFVKAGSIMEEPRQNGLSHFIEHMAFKGTQSRNARQIAEEIDLIGGNVNASTSKLATSYYARTTDKDISRALSLLADMMVHPREDAGDFERERQVILEEIAMEADSPEDLVFNLLHRGLYAGQSLSQTILGSREAISAYAPKDLTDFRAACYQPGNAVLAIAGRFNPEQFVKWAEDALGDWQGTARRQSPVNHFLADAGTLTQDKDVEQAHICLSFPGLPSLHEDRHALLAFSTVFGGGVSSRLFQKVREDQGLVYTIYSAPSFYPDCGEFTIYAACAPKKVGKVLDLIEQERQGILHRGINRGEFMATMAQIRTGFVLGMESAYQRMAAMGMNKLLHDRVIEPKEMLAQLRGIKLKDVNRLARDTLQQQPVMAVVGKKVARRFGAGRVEHG